MCDQAAVSDCQNFCGATGTANCTQQTVQEGNTVRSSYLCLCVDSTGKVVNEKSMSGSASTGNSGGTSQSNCDQANTEKCTTMCQQYTGTQMLCFSSDQSIGNTNSTSYNCQCRDTSGETVAQTSSQQSGR